MGENIGMLGIYGDSFIDNYRKPADLVHNKKGRIILQLVHSGSGTLMKNAKILATSVVEKVMTKTVPKEMSLKKPDLTELNFHGAHNF